MSGKQKAVQVIRFFTIQAEKCFLLAAVLGLGLSLWCGWVIDGAFMREFLTVLPIYMLATIIIMTYGSNISSVQLWYPALISFGCLRHHVCLGNLYMGLLQLVQGVLAYEIACKISGDHSLVRLNAGAVLAIGLIVEGVSQVFGILCMRFGRTGSVLSGVCLGILAGILGVNIGLSTAQEAGFRWLLRTGGGWLLVCGILLSGAATFAQLRLMRAYEVR